MHRYFYGLLLAALIAVAGVALTAHADVDSWSQKGETTDTFTGSSASSVIMVAKTTNRSTVIKSLLITGTVAGLYTIADDPAAGQTTVVANLYLVANTPLQLSESQLGVGLKSSSGNNLTILGPAASVVYTVARIQRP